MNAKWGDWHVTPQLNGFLTKFTDLPAGNLYPTIRYSKATSNKYNYSQYDHCFVCNTGYVELKKALDDQ